MDEHQTQSPEYHAAHLAFARSEITKAATEGRRILDLLHAYTEDVIQAERDLNRGAVDALRELADEAAQAVAEPRRFDQQALGQAVARARLLANAGGR